ncbi:MAG: SulP family inorganic anion transporter, partial [Actinomycetia bacterium]|nr:SulP family inorganic anion transporter [Actinomycetes bacterium]
SFAAGLESLQWEPLVLGVGALVVLFVVQWRLPTVPGPLLVVLLAAALVAVFDLDERGVEVVGTVPQGLPTPQLPDVGWADVQALLLPALGVMIVGFADNVLESRAFAAKGGYEVDSNQELVALGAINAGAGLFQGFPVSSSGSRTALGDAVGSRSQLYSLVTFAAIVATLLFFRPLLAYFPTAVLGAIVVYAAVRLIQVPEFARLRRFRRSEFLLAAITVLGVVLLGILYGVLVAVALSVLELLARVARPHDGVLGLVPGVAGMHSVDDYPEARTVPGLVVYRYDSPLFFANAADFRRRALAAVAGQPEPVRWFLLNVEANVEVDITALDMVEQLRENLDRRGIVLALARVKHDLLALLERAELVDRIGRDRMFPTLPTALAAYHAWRAEQGLPDVSAPPG